MKCPVDGRPNRPVYINLKGEKTLAVADGKGHAYRVYGKSYEQYLSVCKPENRYNPDDYEFISGLTSFDF